MSRPQQGYIPNNSNNPFSNAQEMMQRYYKFKNDRAFPRKKDYHSAKHP